MMTIKCHSCSREVIWEDGAILGTLDIECCGSTVICACGTGISDDSGTLKEFRIPSIIHAIEASSCAEGALQN